MTCNTIQTKLFYEALNSLDQQLRSLLLMKSFLSVIIASIYSVGTPHRKICDLRVELKTKVREDFTITKKAISWLKVPASS